MKKTLLLLVSFIFCMSLTIDNPQRGAYISNITLKNGESVLLNEAIKNVEAPGPMIWSKKKNGITYEESHNLNSSAIIQSFNTDTDDISSINNYINDIQENTRLGYLNILGALPFRTGRSISGRRPAQVFQDYYHSLFQSKSCRKLLFNAAFNIVESLCENYPIDFSESVIQELDELIELTEITHFYNDTNAYHYHEDSYWKGFVRRRVETDNVPISEIHSYLVEARRELLRIDQSLLPTALYEVNFNNEITILLNANRSKYYQPSYVYTLTNDSLYIKEESYYGVINDPDGYTNVREEKSSKSEIVFKVYEEERFEIIDDSDDNWWMIKYNGEKGYIYRDRIDDILPLYSYETRKIYYEDKITKVKYLEDQEGGYYLIEGKSFQHLYDDALNRIN